MKTYTYKVYDASGNYITDWNDVINDISFAQEINSPAVEVAIRLGRKANDYGEELDVKFKNIVKVYVSDNEADAELLLQGYIVDYSPVYDVNEYVEVIIFTFGAELDGSIYIEDETADQSQATGSTELDFGAVTKVAQSFIPTQTTMGSIDIKLFADETVNVALSIQTDSAGSPSGSIVTGSSVTKTITNTTAEVIRFTFDADITLSLATTYWIVLARS